MYGIRKNFVEQGTERMNYEAVFFDFDGVILDSVDVKTQAFAQMFRQYGVDVESKVVAYHLNNGGISRARKFEYFYASILRKPLYDAELEKLCKDFSMLVLEKVLKSPYMPGALESLQNLKANGIPAFVVSGTPDEEIKYITNMRNLVSFFIEVHGSPRQKHEIIYDISRRYGYDLPNCLFIGDAASDLEAAHKCRTQFLAIIKSEERDPFSADVKRSTNIWKALQSAIF